MGEKIAVITIEANDAEALATIMSHLTRSCRASYEIQALFASGRLKTSWPVEVKNAKTATDPG